MIKLIKDIKKKLFTRMQVIDIHKNYIPDDKSNSIWNSRWKLENSFIINIKDKHINNKTYQNLNIRT